MNSLRFIVPLVILLATYSSAQEKLNVLLLTADDMNFDSVGVYGCSVEDTTPNIDSLGKLGMRFEYAYIQTPSCNPSRNVLHTGHYPHNSGVVGFFSSDFPQDTLPEALRKNGYFTGIVQKVIDSTPTNDTSRYWDYAKSFPKESGRTPGMYREAFKDILEAASASGKPFYANVNVQDPHLPFYRGEKTKKGFDDTRPSKIFEPADVPIPPFLPQNDAFAEEIADYYNTVRRGDDGVGQVLDLLDQYGLRENTVIIYLSDHGMSVPFAKSNLYPQGVRTPWIVVWPGVLEGNMVDDEHMISAIDLMPTVLDITDTPAPGPLAGQSIVPLMKGNIVEGRDRVFVEHNEGPTAAPRPMRAIHTKEFVYIFNAWATGDYHAVFESRWYRSYATFSQLAEGDETINARFKFLNYRTVEELYDLRVDPYAMNNVIDDSEYQDVLVVLQSELEGWMRETQDYVLLGFQVRENIDQLRNYMKMVDNISRDRAPHIEWKRALNRDGAKANGTNLAPANLVGQ